MEHDPIELPREPVVDGSWLQQHLQHPQVRILDTRGRIPAPGEPPASMREAFDASHVPGAAFVSWSEDFIDVGDERANQLAPPDRFTAAARRLGISADTLVIAYDDYRSIFAARLWWAFRAMGHDLVYVLDGGWSGWQDAGRPTSSAPPTMTDGTFTANPRPELCWSMEQVAGRAGDVVLVDARSRERFAGLGNDLVPGRIPGAVNAPYAELVGVDGFLRPRDELAATLRAAGIDPLQPPRQLVGTCGSGISASVPLLALELCAPGAGRAAAVYDGSWAEWSQCGQPIERGTGRMP